MRKRRHTFGVALAGVGLALALTACGSSGNSNQRASSRSGGSGIKFADCMRSHGVPNFPDPSTAGGGVQFNASSGINPRSPAFQSAQNECMKLMPGGGPLHGPVSEARKLQMLHLAQCMRAHGVPTFPDPTSGPPPSPPAGGGIAFGGQGAFIAVPQSLMQSPAFKVAAAKCNFPGARGNGAAKPAPAP